MGSLSRLLGGVSIRFQAASAFQDADEQRILGALLWRDFPSLSLTTGAKGKARKVTTLSQFGHHLI